MIGSVESFASAAARRPVGIDMPDFSARTIGAESRREMAGLSGVKGLNGVGELSGPNSLYGVNGIDGVRALTATPPTVVAPGVAGPSFDSVLGSIVGEVNTKMQTAEVEKARVMSGETNNLHQAVLSMQEAGVAFSLMTEVRNKMVESYQEIMRMQV